MRGPAYELEDPLTRALAPPPDETVEEREVRLNKEAEAQRVSDLIDESLRAERASWKKRKVLKVLLLGQSESGKTTTLKNMQLAFAPKAWTIERLSWRAVIQLNLVRSVNIILDALAARLSPTSPHPPTSPNISYYGSPPSSPLTDEGPFTGLMPMSPDKRNSLLKLKLRLAPLRQVEADLKARLGDGTEEMTESRVGLQPLYASPFDDPPQINSPRPSKEIIVRSHQSWKNKERERKTKDRASLRQSTMAAIDLDRDDVTEVLAGCSDDMVALWDDPVVQDIVDSSDVLKRLGDSGEYFLHRIADIARRDYTPSDNDVLRARIRTLGVQEYNIVFEVRHERDPWREWAIYDVGGSRTQRHKWIPFFSDVQMLLFLAPISVFDERLAEDRKVNRLEDSFALWDAITKSPLLQKCILIMFMNKCDLLHRKLNRGIMVKKYLPSYGDRDNDYNTVTHYLRKKFKDYLLVNSPARRFYGHMTSVIDAEATAVTLRSVRDGLLQTHLKQANLLS